MIGEGLVETALLRGLVIAQLGLAETAKKLLCAREIGENVFGDVKLVLWKTAIRQAKVMKGL